MLAALSEPESTSVWSYLRCKPLSLYTHTADASVSLIIIIKTVWLMNVPPSPLPLNPSNHSVFVHLPVLILSASQSAYVGPSLSDADSQKTSPVSIPTCFAVCSGVTSANAEVSGGLVALTFSPAGQIQVFVEVNARTLTHEAAHAQDYAAHLKDTYYTQSDTWRQAVSASTCSPTGYAASAGSDGEVYGDAILPYVFNLYRGDEYPAFDTECLEPELAAIDAYARSLSST